MLLTHPRPPCQLRYPRASLTVRLSSRRATVTTMLSSTFKSRTLHTRMTNKAMAPTLSIGIDCGFNCIDLYLLLLAFLSEFFFLLSKCFRFRVQFSCWLNWKQSTLSAQLIYLCLVLVYDVTTLASLAYWVMAPGQKTIVGGPGYTTVSTVSHRSDISLLSTD